MGQTSSRHQRPTRGSNLPYRQGTHKHTSQFTYSDDDVESTNEALRTRQRAASHRSEAQSVRSSSRRLKTTSGNGSSATSRTKNSQRHPVRAPLQRKKATPDRHHQYDEAQATRRPDVDAHWSASPKAASKVPRSVSHRRKSRSKKECTVCAENRSLSHFPSFPPTAQCVHDVEVCRRCLRTWIGTTFASKLWDEINCPTCSERLDFENVRESAPSEVFRKYEKLSTKATLEAIPGFHWCITKGCKSGQVIGEASAKFRCVKCKKTYCIEHNRLWHKGETCKEYDYRFVRRGLCTAEWY